MKRAFRQYEQAMGSAANMADRMSQMEAMDGAARCLESLRLQASLTNFSHSSAPENNIILNSEQNLQLQTIGVQYATSGSL